MGEIPKFRDLVDSHALEGDKATLTEMAGKKIIVTGYRITESKYSHKGAEKKCATVQFRYAEDPEEKLHVVFTGSGVIAGQLEEIGKQLEEKGLPFLFEAMVQKIGDKYWSFV